VSQCVVGYEREHYYFFPVMKVAEIFSETTRFRVMKHNLTDQTPEGVFQRDADPVEVAHGTTSLSPGKIQLYGWL
jgi:hypothetical protein